MAESREDFVFVSLGGIGEIGMNAAPGLQTTSFTVDENSASGTLIDPSAC